MHKSDSLPLVADLYHGIGDIINQRPFVKALASTGREVYVKTPLPEFFCDIHGLKFIRANTPLRTQKKMECASLVDFCQMPHHCEYIHAGYGNDELREMSIMQAFEKRFGIPPAGLLDMPSFRMAPKIKTDNLIAVIRPNTEREEWCNRSRGTLNEYIDTASRLLEEKGYHCISIADTSRQPGNAEWITDFEPFAHEKYHYGQLSITETMSLIEHAAVVVTGVGFVLAASLAYRTPTLCILGGHGGNNHPDIIADPRYMDTSQVGFIFPDTYCMCQSMDHACDKTITGLAEKINGWLDEKHL